MSVKSLFYAVGHYRILSAAWRWWEFEAQRRGIFLVDFYQFEFFEHFHAALHLQGFRISTFEAFDKFFGFRYHFLLFFVLLQLLFPAFGSKTEIFRIVYLVVIDPSHCHFYRACSDVVDKFAVMAYNHNGLSICSQKLLEPSYRLDVEVVGRFVKKQYVGISQKHFGEFYTHTPTA